MSYLNQKLGVMRPLNGLLTFCCFFFCLIIIPTLSFWDDEDRVYSLIFCSYYLLTLYTVWIVGNKQIQPYLLFYLTFGLFIGGRFWANLLGYERNVFEPTFFYSYIVNQDRKVALLQLVMGFMCCSSIGYVFSKRRTAIGQFKIDLVFSARMANRINLLLRRLFLFITIYVLWSYSSKLMAALESGYLSLYLEKQSSEHGTGSSLLGALFTVSVGLAMGYGDYKNKRNYLILWVISSLFMVIIGSRASFGVTLLLLLWIYAQYHKVNLRKLFLLCVASMGVLLFVFSFSIRQVESGGQFSNVWELILMFLYDQGITLMVFDVSKLVDSYPILTYFTRFFPAVGGIASLLTGETYYPQDLSPSGYMCHLLNPVLYFGGQGLGWSILSELHLYSFGVLPLFFLLSLVWGYWVGRLEHWATYSRFFKSYIYIVMPGLLMLPRASVAAIFPYIFYLLVYLFVILFFTKHKRYKKC